MTSVGSPGGQRKGAQGEEAIVEGDETQAHGMADGRKEPEAAPFGRDYRVLRLLGRGGMAELTLAVDVAACPARLCVLKQMHAHLSGDDQYAAMFRDESRLHALLEHPNVPRLFAVAEPPGSPPFLALEYVPGPNVAELLRAAHAQGFEVPVAFAAGIVTQVAEALAWVHELRSPAGEPLGIVHRDLSPTNVVIGWDGTVKLIDFGIAVSARRASTTAVGVYKGNLPYLAPERIRGAPVDGRADQFSLGAVFYELLTGEPMFARDNQFAVIHAILEGQRPRASATRTDLPVAVDAIIARATEIERERHFDSMRDFLAVLAASVTVAPRDDLSRLVERLCPDARALHDELLARVAELQESGADETATEPFVLLEPRDVTLPPTVLGEELGSAAAPTPSGDLASRLPTDPSVDARVSRLLGDDTSPAHSRAQHKPRPDGPVLTTEPPTEPPTVRATLDGPSPQAPGRPPATLPGSG